ncbi:cell division cycle associated 2 isoform X3 [Xenopus laevis]|uniref:Cell division cycle associated 2 isoform X3 n=1 Tax=Xenopus laevis TaxID=8355 RepID=A0A8J1MGW6_XENLA|nr:cell division cycle associated 2 isoform X3 [Xenopus laevis]
MLMQKWMIHSTRRVIVYRPLIVMTSRKVLQEIPILPPSAEKGPQEDVQLPVFQRKQPPAASSWTDIYDECKENVVPPDMECFTEEKEEHRQELPEILEDSEKSDMFRDFHSQSEETVSNSYSTLVQPPQDNEEMKTKTEPGANCTPSRARGESHLAAESCHTPIDFSKCVVAELGITTDSFTKCAGTSPKSQLKHRRRSTIGVRGSPEMNFLICQIAKQRCKEKREPDPLENPFTSPRNYLLKDKMCAFRNAFQVVEEDDGKLPFAGFSEETESQPERGEETAEPPQKKQRIFSIMAPVRENAAKKPSPLTLPSPAEKASKLFLMLWSNDMELFMCQCLSASVGKKIPKSDHKLPAAVMPDHSNSAVSHPALLSCNEDPVSQTCSPKSLKRKVMFSDLPDAEMPGKSVSVLQPTKNPIEVQSCSNFTLKPALKKTPKKHPFHMELSSRFPFWELSEEQGSVPFAFGESLDSGDDECVKKTEIGNSSVKKKRVTFGKALSPELFDRFLPANTPLRRGGTPYHHRKSEGSTTAEEVEGADEPSESLPQPNFDFEEEEETLKPLSLCFEAELTEIQGQKDEAEPRHEMEESRLDESTLQHGLVLSPSPAISSPEKSPSVLQSDTENETDKSFYVPGPAASVAGSRVTRSFLKKKSFSSEEDSASVSQAEDIISPAKVAEKGKSKRDKKIVRIVAKKAQIKAARGKGKKSRGKSKKCNQKPQYVERETVSKKPLLSPIPELPECYPTPPAPGFLQGHGNSTLKKRPTKTKSVLRRSGKVEPNMECFLLSNSNEKDEIEGTSQEADSGQVCLGVESPNIGHTDPPKNISQSTVTSLDSFIQTDSQSSEDSLHATDQLRLEKQQTVLEEKELCKVSVQIPSQNGTRRRSIKRKQQARGEEPTLALLESKAFNTESPKKQTFDLQLINNGLIPSHHSENPLEASKTNSRHDSVLSSATETVETKKSRRSSRLHRRSSALSLDQSEGSAEKSIKGDPPAESQCLEDKLGTCMGEEDLSIEDALRSSFPSEKKVRRSMRLRRDSGVAGLFWVQEEKRKETGRRKSICMSSVSQVETSQPLLKDQIQSPTKENKPVGVAKKTRRRTLCTSDLYEAISVNDFTWSESASSSKTVELSHPKAEPMDRYI